MPGDAGNVRIEATDQDHVALVRIDRPEKRNALDQATREAMLQAFGQAEEDGARAIVLTGTGKTFAAGADLEEMRQRSVPEQRAYLAPPRMYETIEAMGTPVIAAINGHALGAGLELALACDVRLAATTAKLGSPEVRLGIIPGGGGTQRLTRLVGRGQAMRLILTGDAIEAAEALEVGLVEQVTEPDELETQAIELAGRMARWSPIALAQAKQAVRQAWNTHLSEGLTKEADAFCQAFASQDAREGISAFLEKRDPVFKGR